MTSKDIDSRIEALPEKQRKEYESRIEPIREEQEETLLEKHRDDIENQIEEDDSELSDFNVIVSGFLDRALTEYQFIRTEPLIHTQKKNFDVLVAARDKEIAVLVEVERTLLDRLPSKLSRFEGKRDVIESNGGEIDLDGYFEDIIQVAPGEYDYVLSSQHFSERDLEKKAEEREMNLIAWMLASQGNTCRISDFTIKESRTNSFDGHTDDDLSNFIDKVLVKGVEKQDYINFTHSSSKYLKLKHMAIALVNQFQRHGDDKTWDYGDWRTLFDSEVDLMNYLEEEKETMYENFIEYGLTCGVVGKEEDNGGLFENLYKIKTNATRSQGKLVDELMEKMAGHRMEDDFQEALLEEKERIVTELEQSHATGGTTLSDFVE